MYKYTNLDAKLREFKKDRIPSFIGTFESVVYSHASKVSDMTDIDFWNVLNEGNKIGREEGLHDGVEIGVKNFLVSGENQLFVTKEGQIYPFSSMDELYKSDKTAPYIKDFLKDYAINEKIPNMESEYKETLNILKEHRQKKLDQLESKLEILGDSMNYLSKLPKAGKNLEKQNSDYTIKTNKLQNEINTLTKEIQTIRNERLEDIIESEKLILQSEIISTAKLLQ